jgi:ubiquinone/menaquinone biosynthesis C-methylase UbiE
MPIDFHSHKNRLSYTTRRANLSWKEAIEQIVDVQGKRIADIGCGGGIYLKALADMGAATVTGIDFSHEMLQGARENCQGYNSIQFIIGNALHTGLPANQYDVILERALIHHLSKKDLEACFAEALRLLTPEGTFIVQDRIPEDCLLPGSPTNIRGYFFSRYPKLKEKETARRLENNFVLQTLKQVGFQNIQERKLWETRAIYPNINILKEDLLARTGRYILHELTDTELQDLVTYVQNKLQGDEDQEIVEQDRWTIWTGRKGAQ